MVGWLIIWVIDWIGINELSLNLSVNQNMKSEIRIYFWFITKDKYCIRVYEFAMKREWGKEWWTRGGSNGYCNVYEFDMKR